MSNTNPKSLYERLGGYDAICAVANDLLSRLVTDKLLARFWKNRGDGRGEPRAWREGRAQR